MNIKKDNLRIKLFNPLKIKELLELFNSFFRIGLFTFGGGYSMLPMFERELQERRQWISSEKLLDYFAIAQCTPGVIAVNTATFVGYTKCGVLGAAFATFGVVMPSFIIITIIAAILSNFSDIPLLIHAFTGMRVAVAALIAAAVIRLFKSSVLKKKQKEKEINPREPLLSVLISFFLCILAFIFITVFGTSPGYIVASAAIVGLMFYRKV